MKERTLRRDVCIGGLCVMAALAAGFALGAAPPLDWMPMPPVTVISAAEARAVPHTAGRPHPGPIDRAIDQLFFWPSGPGPRLDHGPGAGR